MNHSNAVNDRIRNALWSVLSEVADEVDVEPASGRDGVYTVRIRVGRSMHLANVLWAAEGWPEDVNRGIERRVDDPEPASLLVAARSLSPGSLECIARRGMGWVDETGAARIVLPSGLAVYRERSHAILPPPAAFAWTPAAIAVGEALLTTQDANIRALQAATGVSAGRISRILQAFDSGGFTRKARARGRTEINRTLVEREGLLRLWAPAAGRQRRSQWLLTRSVRDPLKVLTEELAPLLGPQGTWALTGPAAAQLEAPYLTMVPTVHVYVDSRFPERLQTLQRTAGLVPVNEGARFEFWSAHPTTLRLSRPATVRHEDDAMIADLPRVYADLLALGGRNEEAGGHLREVTNLGW